MDFISFKLTVSKYTTKSIYWLFSQNQTFLGRLYTFLPPPHLGLGEESQFVILEGQTQIPNLAHSNVRNLKNCFILLWTSLMGI